MDYAWYFSQSEMEKYLEWIILLLYLSLKSMVLFCVCVFFTVRITPDLLIILNESQNFLNISFQDM